MKEINKTTNKATMCLALALISAFTSSCNAPEMDMNYAAEAGYTNKIKELLQNGADVDQIDSGDMTPVMLAFREHRIQTAKFLFCNGADPYRANILGVVVEHFAAVSNEGKALFDRVKNSPEEFKAQDCQGLIVNPVNPR